MQRIYLAIPILVVCFSFNVSAMETDLGSILTNEFMEIAGLSSKSNTFDILHGFKEYFDKSNDDKKTFIMTISKYVRYIFYENKDPLEYNIMFVLDDINDRARIHFKYNKKNAFLKSKSNLFQLAMKEIKKLNLEHHILKNWLEFEKFVFQNLASYLEMQR